MKGRIDAGKIKMARDVARSSVMRGPGTKKCRLSALLQAI
jgi:hypothetical protein